MSSHIPYNKYALDLTALMKWVSSTPKNEQNESTIITQTFPIVSSEELEDTIDSIATKEISESKSTKNETMNGIRYDVIKTLLGYLMSDCPPVVGGYYDAQFPQAIAFNTLLNEGFLIEIND